MSLSREAIQEIIKGADAKVIKLENGRTFITKGDSINEINPYTQGCLKLSTLQGIVDYINKDVDGSIHKNNLTIVIDSPTKVSIYKELNARLSREKIVEVSAIVPHIEYNYSMDSEKFIVNLLSNFLEADDRDKLIEIVSNMSSEEEAKVTDDGISQEVVMKKGVRKEVGAIKNPVQLRPVGTFTEVEQPQRPFIFRVKNISSMCLYEGNDTIWINQAKNRIKNYLEEKLKEYPVKIIL